ncbi:AAA family ATPase [Shewanella sp. CG12_big_fil_rev_8_21_14_0_65_47_15]|uniref:AAA family ATPase n=1 Tax=Shewanella sp. CG12_big_fil_rev_8_21_14_0_65_47_15 TaxID=1975537 RepID=UPI000CA9DA8F|nr:AAA family ATPase [Shewanella sp. CG12_big_fil_rev_8_21_14_0_65_47_15]PIW62296.1 MAG: AAA family ATPase [Shewanella sp. CG12_big_fil_rev_8_21_14_0_65_47_15]
MTFQGLVLLPSQEALIQRLHHSASYSDQLLVLSGGQGSGKTTLLTALATDFDESNAALVICPMHADNAEIRRKILVQLISSPIFDDEIPLAETLLRVASTQTKPLHIIIDDAHLLSKELWAECIILNQIQCAGKNIAVTLAVPPVFLAELLSQLPESLRRQVLPVSIESLSLPEREALYQTLLRCSEQNPFTPRDIVRAQLEKQTGTPQEVINLLELALHGQPEKKSLWTRYKVAFISIVSVLVALVIWFAVTRPFIPEPQPSLVTYPAIDSPAFLALGQQRLAPYFDQRLESFKLSQQRDDAIEKDPLADFHGEEPQADADAATEPPVDEASSKTENVEPATTLDSFKQAEIKLEQTKATNPLDTADTLPKTGIASAEVIPSQKPTKGYTIQVATISQLDSLYQTLKMLEGAEDVRVAKYKHLWVVLAGNYSDSKLAHEAAAKLTKQYHLDSLWVRKWAELGGYQLQETYPNREISE